MRRLIGALRSGHWPSLIGAWLHFEVSFMVWLLIGALGVFIAEEFRLTATQKGFLVGVPLLGGALLRIVVGACTDKIGSKPIGIAILICEIAAVSWGWLGATSYEQVLGVGLFLGCAGASFAVTLPLASRAYPPAHQGLAMGVAASANSGTVLAAFFAPRLGQIVGWHGVFGLMLLPLVATLVLFAWLIPGRIGSAVPAQRADWGKMIGQVFRLPSLYWLSFLYAVTFGGFVGFCSFLPIFFHDEYELHLVTAGTLTALCGLVGSLIRPVGGYVADRLGGVRVLLVVFLAIAGCVLAMAQLPAVPWAVAAIVTAVAAMGFGNGVVFQVVADRFRQQIGMATGVIGAAGGFGGFLLPVWLGVLKDATGSYRGGFLLCAAVSTMASLSVAAAIWRRRRVPIRGADGPFD